MKKADTEHPLVLLSFSFSDQLRLLVLSFVVVHCCVYEVIVITFSIDFLPFYSLVTISFNYLHSQNWLHLMKLAYEFLETNEGSLGIRFVLRVNLTLFGKNYIVIMHYKLNILFFEVLCLFVTG